MLGGAHCCRGRGTFAVDHLRLKTVFRPVTQNQPLSFPMNAFDSLFTWFSVAAMRGTLLPLAVLAVLTSAGAARAQEPPSKMTADAPETNADLRRKLKTITIPRLAFREASV